MSYELFANTCGRAYHQLNRIEDALQSFELAASDDDTWLGANLLIGDILISQGKLQEGADRYVYVINRVKLAEHKEIYKGVLLVKLYPGRREQLLLAKGHFEKALELKPDMEEAAVWVEYMETVLAPTSESEEIGEA